MVIEKRFTIKNLDIIVVFIELGYRCGYVGVPENNKYYKKDYNALNHIFKDGELTWSDFIPQFNPDLWYIGFDCGHYNQGVDISAYNAYFPGKELPASAIYLKGRPVTITEACETCIKLAKLLM